MKINFKKLIPEAKTPTKLHKPDAGYDFYCTSIEHNDNYIIYHTGIAVDIPEGMVGLAFPRSSIIHKDLMLKNSVGVVDSGYIGEIKFMFTDLKQQIIVPPYYNAATCIERKQYEVGDRIGQLIFLDLPEITLIETDQLSETDRGTGGFGSTNK